jgi:gamma-glutamyltranspeptidase/glutathione hydrolase
MIEAVKVALSDRAEYVGDPAAMRVPPERLIDPGFVRARAATIDRNRAGTPAPRRALPGGTAYMCATDSDGMCVSLIQSNFMGFGSGVHVEEWGINLHNRGGRFSLDPSRVDAIGPMKRPLHTLIPAMVLRDGSPWLVFGTMGGDGQLQTHLQLLTQILDDGIDPQAAIDAPRWFVDPADWTVFAEPGLGEIIDGLASMGHAVRTVEPLDALMGHAHAIAVHSGGFTGATDPRTEGAVRGI